MSGDRLDVLARERIRKRVDAALKGEEYSVIEMAHDLERLATHPVWEQADQCAQDLEGAVEALQKIVDLPMPDGNASCATALEHVKLIARNALRGQS